MRSDYSRVFNLSLKLLFTHCWSCVWAVWHNLTEKKKKKPSNKQHILACLRQTHPSIMPLSGRAPAEQPSALLSPLPPQWLPAACGHNTAHRHRSTRCTVVRTSSRPAGSSPSSSPTSGRPRERSRLGRKSMWRGHWLLSGPRLPERTEVGPVPDTQAQARSGAKRVRCTKAVHDIDIVWLPLISQKNRRSSSLETIFSQSYTPVFPVY